MGLALLEEGISGGVDESEAQFLAGAGHGRGEITGQQDGFAQVFAESVGELEKGGRCRSMVGTTTPWRVLAFAPFWSSNSRSLDPELGDY